MKPMEPESIRNDVSADIDVFKVIGSENEFFPLPFVLGECNRLRVF
jgi:hypothetical protein